MPPSPPDGVNPTGFVRWPWVRTCSVHISDMIRKVGAASGQRYTGEWIARGRSEHRMTETADDLAIIGLGKQLRSLREEKGLSLRALAAEVDVTASFLSQVERGLCSPSLSSLRHLARVHEVPVFQLLVEFEVGRPVVRADERVAIRLPGAPVVYELLSSGTARSIEMFIVRISVPHQNLVRRLSTPTEECLHVVSGTLSIEFGGETHVLTAGDTVTYDGMALTSLMSTTDEELVLIAAVTPPSF